MKKILYLATITLIFNSVLFAQSPPPPPPPPAIFNAPDSSKIKTFTSKEDNFSIGFFGNGNVVFTEEDEFNKAYSAKMVGSNQVVKVITLNEPIEQSKIKSFLAERKRNYLGKSNVNLVYDKEFENSSWDGIEFAFEEGYVFKKVRIVTYGVKVYEIYTDVTNWHILKGYKTADKVKEFEGEANRFLNSFKYVPTAIKGDYDSPTLPKVKQSPVKVPAKPKRQNLRDTFSKRTKRFNSPRGAFSAYFPFRPRKRVNKVESTEGKTDFVVHEATTRYVSYSVAYVDSPTVVTVEQEKDLNYELQVQEIANKLRGKRIKQNAFNQYGYKGKDYVITTRNLTISVRMFFAKQRLFRLAVLTRGRPNRKTGKLSRTNQRLVNRLFNSFKVTELPKSKFAIAELPEDFGDKINGNSYESSFFDFSSKVPEGWKILSELETDLIMKYGTELTIEETKNYKDLAKKSAENTKVLFLAMKQESEEIEPLIITVAAESLSTPVFSPKSVLQSNVITKEDNEKITVKYATRMIDGIEFAWYEYKDTNDQSLNRLYIANLNNLAFEIAFLYYKKEDLKDLEAFLNTIKFEKNK